MDGDGHNSFRDRLCYGEIDVEPEAMVADIIATPAKIPRQEDTRYEDRQIER